MPSSPIMKDLPLSLCRPLREAFLFGKSLTAPGLQPWPRGRGSDDDAKIYVGARSAPRSPLARWDRSRGTRTHLTTASFRILEASFCLKRATRRMPLSLPRHPPLPPLRRPPSTALTVTDIIAAAQRRLDAAVPPTGGGFPRPLVLLVRVATSEQTWAPRSPHCRLVPLGSSSPAPASLPCLPPPQRPVPPPFRPVGGATS